MSCRPPKDGCVAGQGSYTSLGQMVDEYIARKRPEKRKEQQHFSGLPLEKAIETAALAKNHEGKRSGHHRRRTVAQLSQGKARLVAILPALKTRTNFEDLHNQVRDATQSVKGLGELYVYDASYLIGTCLGLEPEKVYLHAGTRIGAKELGFPGRLPSLDRSEVVSKFPQLKPLKACEMEDFLCIYATVFRSLRRRTLRLEK